LRNYRSKLDIIADILDAASKNAKKTQIMYQANLSFKVLQKYLKRTLAASLIIFEQEYRYYSLTDKGQAFLETYKEYAITNKNIENQVNDLLVKKKILEQLSSSN
jgi:predicted transcriptional regulator